MRGHKQTEFKKSAKKVWNFIWNDDSIWSWLVNVVLAFILIKFIVYPLLALMLGTQLPVVAVISESMSHTPTQLCDERSAFTGNCIKYDDSSYEICGKVQAHKEKLNLDNFWFLCGDFYKDKGINRSEFGSFNLANGFEKGDVIILKRANPDKLKIGDVLVFVSNLDPAKARPYPIIHRIIKIDQTSEGKIFQTKGDHNSFQIVTSTFTEAEIKESQIIGQGVAKIPWVGYIKLLFVDFVNLLH